MQLYLVRHGETQHNLDGIIQGQSDTPLTPVGKLQAQQTGLRFKGKPIDIIYSSDLSRAKYSAEQIAAHTHASITCLEALRERAFGDFTGRKLTDYVDLLRSSGQRFYEYSTQGGESLLAVEQRVQQAWRWIWSQGHTKSVVITSHNGPLSLLIKFLLDKRFDDWRSIKQDNACVSCLEINAVDQATVVFLNDTSHLSSKTGNRMKFV